MDVAEGGRTSVRHAQRDDQMSDNELRDFLLVLRRALLVIVRWIEKRYGTEKGDEG